MRLPIILALSLLSLLPVAAQETTTVTDDAGRSVTIPAQPARIATLDDLRLTVPLIELGVQPIASHGRVSGTTPYIRASRILTGVDFDNSAIAFLGNDLDIEALAKAEPDLIITLASRAEQLEQLEKIAPTLVFDPARTDYLGIYDRLAEITGAQDRLAYLKARYEAQLAQLRHLIDTASITVSVFDAVNGTITVQKTYGSLGIVLQDAGFQFPEIYDTIAEGTEIKVSAEYLPQLDADIVFDTIRADRNETPADADARMREVLDSYCQALWACTNDQYFVLPREDVYAISYAGLSTAISMVTALMSAQQIELRP